MQECQLTPKLQSSWSQSRNTGSGLQYTQSPPSVTCKGKGGACLRRGTCYECSSWHHEHLHRALFRPVRHRSGMKLLEKRSIPNLEVARQRTTPIRQILESLVPVSTESTREHANVSEDTLMREGRWSESERILHGTYIVLQEVYPYAPQNQSQSRVKYSQEV